MRRLIALLAAAALAVGLAALPVGATTAEQADVLGQGGVGVLNPDGATLDRDADGIRISYNVPTPAPGSYAYPTSDMVPPGASHPEVIPGYPEVFTLWAFVFNYPALCSDGICDANDLGDPLSKGGVYRVDGIIAANPTIGFRTGIDVGDAATAFFDLENPLGAEVHLAMAPHGMAHSGEDLRTQLNVSVGTPDFWWPALFLAG